MLPLPAFLSATPKHVRQACIERMAQWRLVAALGDVDYAATARTLLQRHCDACTAACAGCSAQAAIPLPRAVHICGAATEMDLRDTWQCLVAHARRPCGGRA